MEDSPITVMDAFTNNDDIITSSDMLLKKEGTMKLIMIALNRFK